MNSSLKIHTGSGSLNNDYPVIYFKKSYLELHEYQQLVSYENSDFFFPVVLTDDFAISIPGSPFGSFFVKDTYDRDQFLSELTEVRRDLIDRGINTLQIKQPAGIYSGFIPEEVLRENEFEVVCTDINQQIRLVSDWETSIHQMQKRKLDSLKGEGFEFRKMDIGELETAHKFIDVCRKAQDLRINISYDLLKQLSDSTKAYDIFGVFREDKISSLCISVRVSDKIAYYYLPATSPMFRSQSPMVLLIAGMVDHYQRLGFEYLDMGLSSVDGKPQESLRIFKERMGADELTKTTWKLQI